MDDERKKPPRKGGERPGGPRGGAGGAKGGKPFRGGGKKPFVKRGDHPGEARADRPKRDFPRDERPRGAGEGPPAERAGKPFRSGPRPDRKPFEKRGEGDQRPGRRDERPRGAGEGASAEGGGRPFRSGPRPDRKPFEKRGEGDQRPYRRDERPSGDGEGGSAERSAKPYRSGPRPDRKPFEKRGQGDQRPGRRERVERSEGAGEARPQRADRPYRAGPRTERNASERKPFEGRGGAGKKPFSERKPFVRRTESAEAGTGERIAKRLARAGIASRRDAEELIAAGRIKVNGKVLSSPAFNVQPDDTIELDGTTIPPIERTRLFLFHKPAGLVTTNRDPEGRKTVFDVLPEDLPRLMTIGRLDINTEGLLLLTNDGGLARVLELPATGWLRRYRVRVHGKVEEKALADLKDGIAVGGVFYGSIEASLDREQGTNAWLTIGLREGKNREVKNILGALGLDVNRLIRISYGPFQLGELPEGAVQELKGKMLRDQLGERLIEEAGANFDAPITRPFSNKPVRAEDERREERPERPRIVRDGERGPIGEGGLIKKNRKREREAHREDVLGRLSTKPDKPGGFRKGREGRAGDRDQRREEPPRSRTTNVWMAPGARPQGKKDAAVGAKAGGKGGKPSFGKAGGGKPGHARPGERDGGDRPRPPRKGKDDADRRR